MRRKRQVMQTSASISLKYLKNHHQKNARFQSTVSLVLTDNSMPHVWAVPAVCRARGTGDDPESALLPLGGTAGPAAAAAPGRHRSPAGLTRPFLRSPALFGVSPYKTPMCPRKSKALQVQGWRNLLPRNATGEERCNCSLQWRWDRVGLRFTAKEQKPVVSRETLMRQRKIFAWWVRLITETDCPERPWYLLPETYLKLDWMIWFQ